MTKTNFLKGLNESFPEEYVDSMNRRQLAHIETYPEVTRINLGNVTHYVGTETTVIITLALPNGVIITRKAALCEGHNYSEVEYLNQDDSPHLDEEYPWLRDFTTQFTFHFTFWFREDYLELSEWNDLPE